METVKYIAWVVSSLLGMAAVFAIPFAIGLYAMWKLLFEEWAKDIERRERELKERIRKRKQREAEMRKPC